MFPAQATHVVTPSTQIGRKRGGAAGLGEDGKVGYGHIELVCLRDIQVKLVNRQLEIPLNQVSISGLRSNLSLTNIDLEIYPL